MISRIACLAICYGLMSAPPALAQQWSPAQTEVWNSVEAFHAKYAAGDLEGVFSNIHENYVGWDLSEPTTSNKARLRKFLDYNFKNEKTDLYDVQPVGINVVGDTAIVYYHFTVITKDAAGEKSYLTGRWADVLKKQDGQWLLIGDHGGVTSSED